MLSEYNSLNSKKIFKFWLPLSITWLMMSVEGPFVAAIIARLAEPKYNLAAYGVAFALSLLIEAPVVMILSASTALVNNKHSYIKLRNFIYFLIFIVTLIQLIVVIPPVFYFITDKIIKLDKNVASLAHITTLILTPWPGAIGFRRFYQGILIGQNKTKRVAFGTVFRLITMVFTSLILYLFFDIRGAYVGATALSMGVTLEAIATKLMCNGVIQRLSDKAMDVGKLSYRYIIKFYYPLALTSYLILGIHPLVTFFVSKSRLSVESLAIYPVLNSLVFIFRSFGFSYQEVGIALLDKDFNNYKPLRNFAFKIGLITTSAVALIAFTPLSHLWLKHVSGLSIDLVNLSLIPLSILVLMPGLTTLLAWQRSILVRTERTFPITIATLIEVLIIIIMFCILIYIFNFVGIIAAAISLVLGRLFANIYLFFPYYKLKKEKILSKEGHYFFPKFIRKKFSTSDGFSGPPLKTKGP